MKYNFKYSIIFLFIGFSLFGSFEKNETGAREQSLGNAIVALNNTPFALFYNPANIQSSASFNVYTSYRNFYGLPGIYQADILANISVYDIGSAFAVSKYGNDLYSEMEIRAGSSYRIAENLSMGMSLQGYFLSIKNYGGAQSWGLNIGLQYDYLEKLSIGAFITNINNPKIGSVQEELPQTFSLGFKYNLIERATLFLIVVFNSGFFCFPYLDIIFPFTAANWTKSNQK